MSPTARTDAQMSRGARPHRVVRGRPSTPLRPLTVLCALVPVALGCSDDAPTAAPCVLPGDAGATALARPILGLDPAEERADRAQLPSGFTSPQDTACSTDATRGFLEELADHPVNDARVAYEWAPVLAGPSATRPVVRPPEFYVAGVAGDIERAGSDLPFTHPFSLDTNFDVHVDDAYRWLVHARNPDEPPGALHAEVEEALLPTAAFGLPLREGDRVLLRGVWILDCGHPPYDAELHPPTFVATARAVDATTTESLALANPYRVAQLFTHDARAVTDFANDARFTTAVPFPEHLVNEIALAALNRSHRIEAHALLEATRFDTLRWQVCAPSPRPTGAALTYTYRFTARTGVNVTATALADAGCVRFTATMGASYRPLVPARSDREYPWDQISRDAEGAGNTSIDVRERVLAVLRAQGLSTSNVAFDAATAPYIDAYPPLAPREGADRSSPTGVVTGADDQPFPFYGRVTVRWCGR